jgi:hypothetical protein
MNNSTIHSTTHSTIYPTTDLKRAVRRLAEDAYNRRLISGYGDGEYSDKYQIDYQGKPRHLPLEKARAFLSRLLEETH